MNSVDTNRLIEWAIVWNRRRLVASGDDGANELLRIMRLDPDFDRVPDTTDLADAPVLTIAADGIRLEVNGDVDGAAAKYTRLAHGPGLEGLLGKLLLAWMSISTEEAFDAVITHLEAMDVRPSIAARVHMKLMTWAKDRGWQLVAREHYLHALRLSRGELRNAIRSQGHWFGDYRVLSSRPLRSELVLFPWILDGAGHAAEVALEDSTKRLSQSPWTRTWRFGGADGAEIQSAELQADWAGAHWLLPQLWRLHASLILSRTEEIQADVPRALMLWIKGNGTNIERLIDRFEGLFDSNTASAILVDGLKLGSVLRGEADWIRVCGALWDQLPGDLAEKLVRDIDLPEDWVEVRPNPVGEEALSLFAVLSMRSPKAWSARFLSLSSGLKNLVLRYMSPNVVDALSEQVLGVGAEAVLGSAEAMSEADAWWMSNGWASVGRVVRRLNDSALLGRFERLLPDSAIPFVVGEPGLLSGNRIRGYLDILVRRLEQLLEESQRGMYTQGGSDPSIAAVRCMVAIKQVHDRSLELILEVATNPRADAEQLRGALIALGMGVDAGIVDADLVRPILQPRHREGHHGFWEDAAAARMVLATRAALSLRFSDVDLDQLVASTKDPDIRVREIGMRAVVHLSAERSRPALDACIVGALYDPEASVQALGVRAVTQGGVADPVVNRICWARLVEMWNEAHRVVRATIADGIAQEASEESTVEQLRPLAANDRSAMVRRALVAVTDDGRGARTGASTGPQRPARSAGLDGLEP